MAQTKETRNLAYKFTQDEKAELSAELASQNLKREELEDAKKSVASEYKSRIDECSHVINRLSTKVHSGIEHRDVVCTIEFHVPKEGEKTITRTDNLEHWIEPMQGHDFNLFNQAKQAKEEEEEVPFDEEQ